MIKNYSTLLFLFAVFFGYAQSDYVDDVLPIFQAHCAGCHGFDGSGFSSGLNLTSEENVFAGANSGPVVVFGDYENSVLYQRVVGEGGYMPPSWSSNEILNLDQVNTVVSWIQSLNDGCTDPVAINYDENAVNDDGSCEYDPWNVVSTDCNMIVLLPADLNITFNEELITESVWIGVVNSSDDVVGSTFYTPGEVNSIAVWGASGELSGMASGEELNWIMQYNNITGSASVSYSNGDGLYACNGLGGISVLDAVSDQVIVDGCTDPLACNYNADASTDDGSCEYVDGVCEVCENGLIISNDSDSDGVCDDDEVFGCTDSTSCTYNEIATEEDGSCEYLDTCGVCGGDNTLCYGCTDPNSCNYGGPSITEDDGSCEYESCAGCSDVNACNYDGSILDDGSCIYDCFGCGDEISGFTYLGNYEDNNYYVSGNTYTWSEANSITQDYGFYLVTINSQEEQGFIQTALTGSVGEVWIGLTDENTENEWEWVTGEPYNFESWVDGQPDNASGNENYVELEDDLGVTAWDWNDAPGSVTKYFIMECGPLYQLVGCTDSNACNYNPTAADDDGSCVYVDGVCETCENGVIIDNDSDGDGICDFNKTEGCVDSVACNYDISATEDDGSCIYINASAICDECSGETDGTGVIVDNDSDNDGLCDNEDPCPEDPDNDTNNNGVWDCEEVTGCTDDTACNYNINANTNDGSCVFAFDCDYCSGELDGSGVVVNGDVDNDGICNFDEISGCTNPNACNFDEFATDDDGSCESLSCVGCIDPLACNYCPDCTISIPATCDYDTCCNDPTASNYDSNCVCVDNSTCFSIPDGCDFDCFSSGGGIYPIPITSSYGAYQISCFGASDGSLAIDFNTMNLVSSGESPYSIQVYQQVDDNNDGFISADEEVFIGVLSESSPSFNNLTAGDYVLIAYDVNGCCGQTLISMDEPGENILTVSDYDPILCPEGETQIDFVIDGAVGQFDINIDNTLYAESVDGGTVSVSSFDGDLDGVPDDFIQLNTSFYFNENFWPDLYNECDGYTNLIYINIENDEDIETGDLIGAFYTTGSGGLQSFGYNTYTASSSGSSLVTIQICEGNENGFNNGEEVIFLVYDVSDGVIYEVDVEYEYNNDAGVFSDVFTVDPSFNGIWISSLSILGESGSVPDFSLIVSEGEYSIQVNRTDSIDTTGDGVLDDAFVCSVIDTVITVVDPDEMSVDILTGGSVCNYLDENNILQSTPGGYIQLDNFSGGTPPYTYSWYNSASEIIDQNFISGIPTLEDFDSDGVYDDLDFLPSDTYTLFVLDANDCSFEIDVILEGSDVQLSTIDIDYNLIACSGGSTNVNVSFLDVNDEGPFTFEWFNSTGDILFSDSNFIDFMELPNIEEGNYSAVITDSFGCSVIEYVSVDVDPSGQIAIFNPFIDFVCDESDTFVSFSDCPTEDGSCVANGNPPFSYSWSLLEDLDQDGFFETSINLGYPETTSSATLEFGTYSFSVTDANDCVGSTVFTLSAPEPIEFTSTVNPIICDGDFATISLEILNGNPGLYDFVFEGDTTTITIGGSSELDFLIDQNTGQFNGDFVTDVNATLLFNDVSIFSLNDVIGVFYTGDNGITCGGSAVYQGESVFSIAVWGDDSSTPEDDGFSSGENMLILLNSNGVIYELDVIDFNNMFDSPYVYAPNGLSAITEIEVGDEFSQGPNFTTGPLLEGSYFVEVYDGNQCYWSELIIIDGVDEYYMSSVVTSPPCDQEGLGEITVDVFGGTVSEGYSFIWTSPDIIGFSVFDFGFSNTLTDLSPGNYNLVVFDDNSCILSESFNVEVETSDPNIYITDELCGADGSIEVCVDWDGDILFNLSANNFSETINLTNDESVEACYTFNDLDNSDVEGFYTLLLTSENESSSGCSYLQSDILVNPAEPIAVEFFTNDAVCDGGTGSVWITLLEGGNPPYEIDWQGISTDFAIVGFHEFVITDANGCEYVQPYAIQNATSIDVDFDIVDNTCYNGEQGSFGFSISGGEGDSYSYEVFNSLNESVLTGNNSSNTLTQLPSDLYTLVVEDEFGCVVSFSEEVINLNTEIIFDELEVVNALCSNEEGSVSLNIIDAVDSDFLYYWNQLDGPSWDVDNDGILNSDDYSIDGGVLVSDVVGFSNEVDLASSSYFVFVESVLSGCFSDTLLFYVDAPDLFSITVDDVAVSCFGDVTSVNPIVFGGSDADIDGDGINNNDMFGNFLDPDIDGDGIYDIDGDCLSNCNDDDSDIDNDGILNENDDYIGGTVYNGISTNSAASFSNGLIFENQFGQEVDPEFLTGGSYVVYAYDSNGCLSNVEEFNIVQPPLLGANLFYDYNAEGVVNEVVGPIDILCYGDSIAMVATPFGGTPPYMINCFNSWDVEFDLANSMLSSGEYTLSVIDAEGCEFVSLFSINNEPGLLLLDADMDGDGVDGVLQYNEFHISCFGQSDGMIEFMIPADAGVEPYNVQVWYNGNLLQDVNNLFSNDVQVLQNLTAGVYDFIVMDANACVLEYQIELIEPEEFSPQLEYVVNASCDEEDDGFIIIRTSGGNPPFTYTIDNSSEVFTTQDTLLVISEDMSSHLTFEEDNYFEEIQITESDIVISNLNGNSWHTITILNDEYSCLDDISPIGYSLFVGSNDDNCLFIPSVFTPNGDGINDYWQIHGIDLYPNPSIRVFNRWGQVVFESLEEEYVPWDGVSSINNKNQEIATYYYVIDLNIDNKNYNGSVTIKR